MGTPRIHGVFPILSVRNVRPAAAFYANHLGFQIEQIMEDDSYAVVRQGTHACIHLSQTDDSRLLAATRIGPGLFIPVEDLDRFWRNVVASSPPTRFRSLEQKPWGLREFHILDLDGCLLRFGDHTG